jgi:cytochrome b involved in lipid metabolism
LVILNFIFLSVLLVYLNNKHEFKPVVKLPTQNIITPTIQLPTQSKPDINPTEPTTKVEVPSPLPTPTPDLFAELSKHNTQSDCWMSINGHLYNFTPFFGQHPGGDSTLSKYCGADATSAYNTKDKAPGKPHSQSANELLQQYLIQ